jgi:hypothetical protein
MRGLKHTFFTLTLISLITVTGFGQTQDSYEYQSEFTWGINKNTSGGLIGGFVFKKARKLNDRVLETYGLEIMNVKHPQELRRNSIITGNFFIMPSGFSMEETSYYIKKPRIKGLKSRLFLQPVLH